MGIINYYFVKKGIATKIEEVEFEDSDYKYEVCTQDSSGSKVYYSNTKKDAWRSVDWMLFGGLYQVRSKQDDVDDMIPF